MSTGRGVGVGIGIRGLSVALGGTPVLHGVDATVAAGGWLAVVGPNGAGKSTLLKAVANLVRHSGEVTVGGRAVRSMNARQRARLVAYAPQVPVLPPELTVLDYVLLGRNPYISPLGRESRHDREVGASVLERLDLAGLADRSLGALSGGEQHRVVLARALAQEARVLLLDEPTAALDIGHQQQVLELVDRLRRDDGLTVVTSLHDLTLAGQYAEAMLMLVEGRVVAVGPVEQVLTESALSSHYGALVRVVPGPDGRPGVQLVRPAPSDRDLAGPGPAGS